MKSRKAAGRGATSRTTVIATGIAAALGGTMLATMAVIGISPSAAGISTGSVHPDTAQLRASSRAGEAAAANEAEPAGPSFHAASLDRRRLTLASAGLGGLHPLDAARFMLASVLPSAARDDYRFLPTEVMRDDPEGFHPVLLARAAPSLDPQRFAGALPVKPSPRTGMSVFEELAVGELAAADLALMMPAPQDAAVPDQRPDSVQTASTPVDKAPANMSSPAAPQTELAYAAPDNPRDNNNGIFGGFQNLFKRAWGLPGPGSGIAVYDIKNAVVYMPNGQRLEAHSGLGRMKDKPRYAHVRMKGPTPPNVYDLRMREARFHGVEAVRLLPTDHDKMSGRAGILAHTYMLRGTNGSNGCVSFRHYDKFLAAFKRGEVKQMIVVPDITQLPTYMASL